MKDPEFVETLKEYDANLQIVVAFRMLPEVVWAMPEYGTFNVHAALLPQYRGAAPINWAIINGETQTGITTFFLDKDIDTGRIIIQKPLTIAHDDDVETVYNGLMNLGADVCMATLDKIIAADGHPESISQDQLITTGQEIHNAPKIFKETCRIDWNQSSEKVYNFIRGLSPYPGARTMLVSEEGTETVLKIFRTETSDKKELTADPGTIVVYGKSFGVVTASNEVLIIKDLQLAGKKRMNVVDFLNGMKNIEDYHVK